MTERCDGCGRLLDRPTGEHCPRLSEHPTPDLAQRIVETVENNLRDRRGISQEWDAVDDETQDEIRDTLVALVRAELGAER